MAGTGRLSGIEYLVMQITDIKTVAVHYPERGRNLNFVLVETDAGISGIGESGITGKELAIAGCVEHYRALLLGQDPMRIEHIWQRLYRGGFFKGGQIATAAISAIDIALWDILGKALDVPVYQLLGGQCRQKAVAYAHVNGDTEQAVADDARRAVDQGYKFVRISTTDAANGIFEPRHVVRQTQGWAEAVRDSVGPDIELCVDFHTGLDPHDSIRLANRLADLDLFFIEDPARSENADAYAQVRSHTNIPIAGGEELATKWEFKPLIERDLIDYVRVDLCIVGGFSEARKIAGWAEAHYQYLAPHNPLGPVSTAACVHLCMASPLVGVQEMPRLPGDLPTVFPTQVGFEDGYLTPPEGPGLGLTIDLAAAQDHPFKMSFSTEYRRPDGAVTNW